MSKIRAFEIAPLPFEVIASLQALGHRIAVARKERGHTQHEFSDMLGVGKQTLVFMEQGKPTVQIGHYARAVWMLEIKDAVLGGFGISATDFDAMASRFR